MQTVVIVGASLAGISAARALRAQGFPGRLVMIGDEEDRPYDRPPLSKDFLAGRIAACDLSLETDQEDLDAQWLLGSAAIRLDAQLGIITLDNGTEVHFDAVVLATGSRARTLPEVAGKHNVHTLRTLADAQRLTEQLRPGRKLVVVGAGFVGTEVASTARSLGLEVTIIGADAVPLAGPLGAPMGALLAGLHEAHGVRLICGARVKSFALDDDDDDVTAVRLEDGHEETADVVVLGIGGVPNVGWLQDSGLELANGVRCDAAGRTNVSGIVAVGDCAAWFDQRSGVHSRLEHWSGALERPAVAVAALLADLLLEDQAPLADAPLSTADAPLVVARTVAAQGASRVAPHVPPAVKPPYFWSDQYGVKLQFSGTAQLADRVEIEAGDPADFSFLAVYYRGTEAVAVLGANQPRLFTRWRKALEKGGTDTSDARPLVPPLVPSALVPSLLVSSLAVS